jgi:hypothetical protein
MPEDKKDTPLLAIGILADNQKISLLKEIGNF